MADPMLSRASELVGLLFQAHPWHGVATFAAPDVLQVYVELVPTDPVKYEIDKLSGHLKLDRPQRFSSLCPTVYGFLPQTYCGDSVAARCAERTGAAKIEGDHDPLDVCILSEKTIVHGNFLARARAIGGLRMVDGDEADDKIIAVLEADLAYGGFQDIGDCPRALVERLEHYFLSYKQQPGAPANHKVRIAEVYDRAEAREVIARSQADYRARFGAPEDRLGELRRLLTTP